LVDLEGSDYILNEYNFKRKERGWINNVSKDSNN
jgi:hypothetical protein